MKLAPRTGMVVIDPVTSQALPADGADVEMSSYWVRRLDDGDVIQADEQKAAPDSIPSPRKTRTRRGHIDGDLIQQRSDRS